METLFARLALLPDGWRENVRIGMSADGAISTVEVGTETGADEVLDIVMPGFCNVHSHAFQRALAGRAEFAGDDDDSFWAWRRRMYALANQIGPDDMRSIARLLFVEMLEAGYTSVGEFHYLHHDRSANVHEEPLAMSVALAQAAAEAGLPLTLLPVLYRFADFGDREPEFHQKRFVNTPEQYVDMVSALRSRLDDCRIGIAFHSLRAVDLGAMRSVVAALKSAGKCPIHIHVAEQPREVEDCLRAIGKRPVEALLLDDLIDESWCLIHATHIDRHELPAIAASGAVVGLCPTTEANLGDGVFPLREFLAAEGRFAIGSDSHVSLDPFEELRWLEYGQRLVSGKRARAATTPDTRVANVLVSAACTNGARALGLAAGEIAVGRRANLISIDPGNTMADLIAPDDRLNVMVFAARGKPVEGVMIDGRWVLRQGRHPMHDLALAEYRACVGRLDLA